jgi:hypothetical protein
MSDVSEFGKEIGLMHELVITGRKVGFDSKRWGSLAHNQKLLSQMLDVMDGRAEIKPFYFIDCNMTPIVPSNCVVLPEEEQLPNRIKGLYKLDMTKVKLRLVKGQPYRSLEGHKLRKLLEKEAVLPANVLDFLLKKENWHLIPEEWKDKSVYFWGTIYRDTQDNALIIREIGWNGDEWNWGMVDLDESLLYNEPTAVSVSN